jgi:hypothetical protein
MVSVSIAHKEKPPKLMIASRGEWPFAPTGGKKYMFGDGVGERERKWIVTEIREWLQESKN